MFGFIRSGLRRMSVRWAPQQACRQAARRPYTGSNKRQKWEYQCDECGGWFAGKDVATHHKVPCGTLKDWGDIEGFARRLFCEADGFVVLCDACHGEAHQ